MDGYPADDVLSLAHGDPLSPCDPEPKLYQGMGEEMGVTLDLPFSNLLKEADGKRHYEVFNPEPITIERLVNMRRSDAQVRALMRMVTLPVRAALRDHHVHADQGGEAEAEFVKNMLNLPAPAGGMVTPFRQVINQALLAIVDGFAAFELVYKMPTDGPLAGKYTLHKIARRPPHTVTFTTNEQGEFCGIRQRTTLHGRTIDAHIPKGNVFYFAAQEEENPMYGVSYFLPAYWHHDKKIKLYYLMHLAAQMYAVPGRVGKEPPNASKQQKDAFFRALKDYGLGGAMRLPMGFEFEEFQRKVDLSQFIAAINHHNTMMSKSVLAQEALDQGERESTPFISNSSDAADIFMQQVATIMEDLESKINELLIPKFIDWNFGTTKYPRWEFADLSSEQRDVIHEMFGALATSPSVNVTPDFVFELERSVATELGMGDLDYEGQLKREFQERKQMELDKDKAQLEQAEAMAEQAENKAKNPMPSPGIGGPGGGGPGAATPGGPGRNPLDEPGIEARRGKLPPGRAGERVKRDAKASLSAEQTPSLDTIGPPVLLSDVARRLMERYGVE
jgi:hypothetical protein